MFKHKTLYSLLRQASIASCLLLTQVPVHAIEFQDLTITSLANRPFSARLALTDITPADINKIKVAIVTEQTYAKFGRRYNPLIQSLTYIVQTDGSNVWIEMQSPLVMGDEPFDLYLGLITPMGSISKWFAVPVPARSRFDTPPRVLTSAQDGARQSAGYNEDNNPTPNTSAMSSVDLNEIKVTRGMTLSKIIDENNVEGFTRNQQLVAWQRANQHAFIGQNINRIRSDAVLTPPSEELLRSISEAEANREMSVQTEQFNNTLGVRSGPASVPTSQQQAAVMTSSDSSNVKTGDRLTLSADNNNEQEATANELIVKQKEIDALTARNTELEADLANTKNLLQVQLKEGNDLQARISELENKTSANHDRLTWLLALAGFIAGSGVIGAIWFVMRRKKTTDSILPTSDFAEVKEESTPESKPAPLPLPEGLNLDLPPTNVPPATPVAPTAQATPAVTPVKLQTVTEPKIPTLQTPAPAPVVQKSEPADPQIDSQLLLAQGYMEINDKDSARELLNVILEKGNKEQVARAQALINSL